MTVSESGWITTNPTAATTVAGGLVTSWGRITTVATIKTKAAVTILAKAAVTILAKAVVTIPAKAAVTIPAKTAVPILVQLAAIRLPTGLHLNPGRYHPFHYVLAALGHIKPRCKPGLLCK